MKIKPTKTSAAVERGDSPPSSQGAFSNPIDRVEDGLFLGTYDAARQPALLRALNIGRVVNVTAECSPPAGRGQETMVVPVLDRDHARLLEHFDAIRHFIDEGAARGTGTLVHCRFGVSRSATVVLAYLMSHHRWRLSEAWVHLRSCRPEVEPNPGFLAQLRAHELQVFGNLETTAQLTVLDAVGTDASSLDADPLTAMRAIADRCATAPSTLLGREMDRCAEGLRGEAPDALTAALPAAAYQIWRVHGGTSSGEIQAREVFAGVWQRLVRAAHPPLSTVEGALDRMARGESWADFLIDVPLAPRFLRELRQALAPPA